MSERMTDERLAEIEVGVSAEWFDSIVITRAEELLSALKAERKYAVSCEHTLVDREKRICELERKYEKKLGRVTAWAWELYDHLQYHQCGDGCNGCPVCRIPEEACDSPDELLAKPCALLGDDDG